METNKRLALRGPQAGPFIIETNPNKVEPANAGVTFRDIMDSCGFLPEMFVSGDQGEGTFKANLERNYPFGTNWSDHATITDELVYEYPEDEPLHPLAVVTNTMTGEQGAIYRYGIVAVRNGTEGWVSARLD